VQANVIGVDSQAQNVVTDQGVYPYWRLVVATGSSSAPAPMSGGDLTMPVWNFEDACNIRRRAEFGVRAAISGKGLHWLNHVIIGGGFVGVEVAAELANRLKRLCAREGLAGATPQVTLVELAPRLLSRSPLRASHAIQSQLRRAGVKLHLGRRAQEVTADGVLLDNGEFLAAAHVIWAGGTRPAFCLNEWGLADERGRIAVDSTLRALRSEAMYALGDAAHIAAQDGVTEPSAHVAIIQGALVAGNIAADLTGRKPKAYQRSRPIYAVATGPWQGVMVLPGVWPFASRFTPWAKQLVIARHLWSMGGMQLLRTALPTTFATTCRVSAWDRRPVEDGCLRH
jgi:NADH dehydrogenase